MVVLKCDRLYCCYSRLQPISERPSDYNRRRSVYLNSKIPCKRLEQCNENGVESLWISLRPCSLPRNISSIILSVIYHTTSSREPENVILQQHIQRNLDNILANQPNALVIITGDFNPSSTGLKLKDLTQTNHLKQLVTFRTRDSGILDWSLQIVL